MLDAEAASLLFFIERYQRPFAPSGHGGDIRYCLEPVVEIRKLRHDFPVLLHALPALALQGKKIARRADHCLDAGKKAGQRRVDLHHRDRQTLERADAAFGEPFHCDIRYGYFAGSLRIF